MLDMKIVKNYLLLNSLLVKIKNSALLIMGLFFFVILCFRWKIWTLCICIFLRHVFLVYYLPSETFVLVVEINLFSVFKSPESLFAKGNFGVPCVKIVWWMNWFYVLICDWWSVCFRRLLTFKLLLIWTILPSLCNKLISLSIRKWAAEIDREEEIWCDIPVWQAKVVN